MKVFKAFIKPFKVTQRCVKFRAGFEREELIRQNLKCLLKVYCKNILSLSEEIHSSISEPEDKNLLREMHVCGKLVLFCFVLVHWNSKCCLFISPAICLWLCCEASNTKMHFMVCFLLERFVTFWAVTCEKGSKRKEWQIVNKKGGSKNPKMPFL